MQTTLQKAKNPILKHGQGTSKNNTNKIYERLTDALKNVQYH